MARALYAPDSGYYMRPGRRVGRGGDFSTTVTLHPGMARALLAWAWAQRRDGGGRSTLVELGAGSGELAAGILSAAGWRRRRRLDYRIVEISPALEDAQRSLLGRRRVRWFRDVAAALDGVEAPIVFSNEFVDAFPCRQLERRGGRWLERFVAPSRPGRARVVLDEPEPPLDAARFSALDPACWPGGRVPEGQRVEVHASYARWLDDVAPRLASGGQLLTIDYGDVLPALYAGRRGGTLRGYLRHQRLEGDQVLAHAGRLDLTADVNFSDLRAWGETAGLVTRCYETQRAFLLRWLPERLRSAPDPALSFVLDPDGAGSAFKVLWQEGQRSSATA
jgi:SAM-dependent MidA family methyltransferase